MPDSFSSTFFRRPEPVYDDIVRHPFPSWSFIQNVPTELKNYYLKVLQHLETECDFKTDSRQKSNEDDPIDPKICDS